MQLGKVSSGSTGSNKSKWHGAWHVSFPTVWGGIGRNTSRFHVFSFEHCCRSPRHKTHGRYYSPHRLAHRSPHKHASKPAWHTTSKVRVYVATALSGQFVPMRFHISFYLSELGHEIKKMFIVSTNAWHTTIHQHALQCCKFLCS